jgi:hypothetical protein
MRHFNMFQLLKDHVQGVKYIVYRGSNPTAVAVHNIRYTVH